MPYTLYYWPTIQGRGEFVRLALEEAGAAYVDVARGPDSKGRGMRKMMALLESDAVLRPPFAPPFLEDGDVVVAQTAAILFYLGPRLGLVPADETSRLWAQQIQLTLTDLVAETHDTHHPISTGDYYENQKPEARRRAKGFREERIPKFLGWCERILERNPSGPKHLVGAALSYPDLSLFQVVAGLRYAFPKATGRALADLPEVTALHAAVMRRPNIAAYLESERRIPFNTEGIFRHYPELDG